MAAAIRATPAIEPITAPAIVPPLTELDESVEAVLVADVCAADVVESDAVVDAVDV
jgi:hypothetical protein